MITFYPFRFSPHSGQNFDVRILRQFGQYHSFGLFSSSGVRKIFCVGCGFGATGTFGSFWAVGK